MLSGGIFKKAIQLLILFGLMGVVLALVILLQSKSTIYKNALSEPAPRIVNPEETIAAEPFPISINVATKEIRNNPAVDIFFNNTLANSPQSKNRWWNQMAAVFSASPWFQNLASPVSRIIVVWPGERKEEIIKNVGDILRWDSQQRLEFETLMGTDSLELADGTYFPGQYVTHRYASPQDITTLLKNKFDTEISNRYTTEIAQQVSLPDALIIASLLEREASDFENMREVSGVIWNRIFIDMPLQLDATLQYARANDSTEPHWWPAVVPADKYIESPYNTYANSGLPPGPIANPSAEAVLAALNPINTDCLYYFHDTQAGYYCSETYEEHVVKIREIYGQ